MASQEWVQMETATSSAERNRPQAQQRPETMVNWGDRVPGNEEHECTIYVRNTRSDELVEILKQTSDPKSSRYGKHLSKSEVDAMTRNPEGEQVIIDYLTSHGIRITSQNPTTMKAVGTIEQWETALNTQFFHVQRGDIPSHLPGAQRVVRARQYFLPRSVAAHVDMILGTVQLPIRVGHGPIVSAQPMNFDAKDSMLVRDTFDHDQQPTGIQADISE